MNRDIKVFYRYSVFCADEAETNWEYRGEFATANQAWDYAMRQRKPWVRTRISRCQVGIIAA